MTLRWRGADTGLDAVRAGDVVTLTGSGEPESYEVEQVAGPCWVLRRDGRQHVAHVALRKDACWIHVEGRTHVVERSAPRGAARKEIDGSLLAPMTGKIIEVPVSDGSHVEAGAIVVVLSAMKMRVEVKAQVAGTVRLSVREGEQVEGGTVVATVERESK